MERQPTYEITQQERAEARRDAIDFIVNNSDASRQQLERKTDRQVTTIYNRLLRTIRGRLEERADVQMRNPSQIDLSKMVEIQERTTRQNLIDVRDRFRRNPSLRTQQRMLGGEVMNATNLPLTLSRIIGEYASEPDIRLRTIPAGLERRPRPAVVFKKIIKERGGDFRDILDGDYKTKSGVPVTKASQISDYVLQQIYDDFSDEDLKALIDPTLPDDSPPVLELKAIRKALVGKKSVVKAQQEVKERQELERDDQEVKEREVAPEKRDTVRVMEQEVAPDKNQQYDYALLNKAIYSPNPQSVLDSSPRGKKFYIFEEDVNYMVVQNTISGQITFVLKGTDITDVKGQRKDDLIQDIGILLNNEDMVTRTAEMDNIAKRLIEEYGEIDVTGHSLSGYMANKISQSNDINAIVFNIGSSPLKKSSRDTNDRLVHYTTNVGTNIDPISMTAARLDYFNTIQVQPDQDIGSGIIKYHTIDHFLEKEKNLGENKMEAILSIEDIEPEREQRDPLADSVVRRVNQNFSFMENPLVPERNQGAVSGIIEDNREMKYDPQPIIEPNEHILVQDRILEGAESRMPEAEAENEIGRRENQNIAGTNMSSMEQNYFFRIQDEIRRRQMQMLGGEEDDEKYGDFPEEKDAGIDVDDYVPFEEGLSNRELVEKQIKRMHHHRRGKWSGVDRGSSEDWRRIMSAKAKEDYLLTAKEARSMRDEEIPWKAPTRTYANSYVGLIRNSNLAMTRAVGELLP